MAESSSPTHRGRARTLGLRALALALGLVLGELGCRALLAALGRPYDGAALARALEAELVSDEQADLGYSPEPGLLGGVLRDPILPHPYVGFDAVRDADELALQLAARAADPAARQRHYVVLVLGGSVAEYFADPVNGGLEPLRAALAGDPRSDGRAPLFLAHGRTAYKQPQQLLWFVWMLALGLEPDLVVNIDGFNECAIAAYNHSLGATPLYPLAPRWAASVAAGGSTTALARAAARLRGRELAASALRLGLHRSASTGSGVAAWLGRLGAGQDAAERRLLEELEDDKARLLGPLRAGSLEDAVRQQVDAWADASRALAVLCASRGIEYLHVLQPTLHDPGSKSATPEELADGTLPAAALEGVKFGYPLLRARGAELSAEGVAFVDASRVFVDHPGRIYFDACHFVRPGTELLGAAIARALRP